MLSKLKKGKDECPFNEDVTLEKVPHVKPTPAHENYNVGDIIEVMFMPEQEVLILEKITCGDDLCQFIGYSSTSSSSSFFLPGGTAVHPGTPGSTVV